MPGAVVEDSLAEGAFDQVSPGVRRQVRPGAEPGMEASPRHPVHRQAVLQQVVQVVRVEQQVHVGVLRVVGADLQEWEGER